MKNGGKNKSVAFIIVNNMTTNEMHPEIIHILKYF